MKKTIKFMSLAVAAMGLAACSSDFDEVTQAPVQWNADGSGYVAFNLSMPSSKSGRFAVKHQANDDFNNGDLSEYAVKNAVLLIFDGEEEATAQFHSAYTLEDSSWGTANSNEKPNVTVDNKFVVKVEGAPSHPKAFVVLNNNGLFTVDPVTHTLSVKGESFPVGHSFSELANKSQTDLSLNAGAFGTQNVESTGILMVNAPLFSQSGESSDPTRGDGGKLHLLVPVSSANVYSSKAAALEATAHAASVYVERAVAKVTVKAASNDVADSQAPFTAKMENWTLDNTNKSSYLVRNTVDFNTWANYHNDGKYRMVGASSVGHASGVSQGVKGDDAYRTYFAKDTNYGSDVHYGTETNKAAFAADAYTTLAAMGSSAYCAENTFDVEHMTYGNTTRAILKATVTPKTPELMIDGNGFYSKPGDDKFYTKEQMVTLLQNYVNAYLVGLGEKVTISGTVNYTTTVSTDYKTFTVKAENVTKNTGLSTEDAAVVDALLAGTKEYSIHTIGYDFYTGGVCYYDTRIQHFGQDYTPWAAHDAANVEQAYGVTTDAATAAQYYLGRWGVLRNNWYELNVSKVTKIGYAHPWNLSFDPNDNPDDGTVEDRTQPPYDPNVPDDNQASELWMSVDVNILSWAKRSQNVEL